MSPNVSSLPAYLKNYCSFQDYSQYTSRDQAVWRYIMRQNRSFFKMNAHSIYLEGLAKTGIPITKIPKIEEMDLKLSDFGWGAVPVSGFIPPAAFMSFQAARILPIATQMRRVENIAYTPAPDIVHEAAGHAPIIADKDYREYLQKYSEIARKAIISKQDLDIYEAIRYLSDIKEDPDVTDHVVNQAQAKLDAALNAVTHTSEATKASRMAWWTTEYGLVYEKEQLKIYGAGLLSSVGESQHCLSEVVQKIPLSLSCIDTSYDITKPQPQLFVAKNIPHLTECLEDFANTLSFRRGGEYAFEQAKLSKIVNTLVFSSGLQLSARLKDYHLSKDRQIDAVCVDLNVAQVCYSDRQIESLRIKEQDFWLFYDWMHPAYTYQVSSQIKFTRSDGTSISGTIENVVYTKDKKPLIVWLRSAELKQNVFGHIPQLLHYTRYPVVLAQKIVGVFGGAADRDAFGDYDMGHASTDPGRKTPLSDEEKELMNLYREIRSFREAGNLRSQRTAEFIQEIGSQLNQAYPDEWLAYLELMELNAQSGAPALDEYDWYRQACLTLEEKYSGTTEEWLIHQGTKLLYTED